MALGKIGIKINANLGLLMIEGTFQTKGYAIILAKVRNIYPVEKWKKGIWIWGVKYGGGFKEYFSYRTEREATQVRDKFMEAIEKYFNKAA